MDKELPLNERERRQNRIRYYQWVPFLLLFQAILCYIPRIIWRTLNVKSGLDIINLVDAAIKYESVDKFGDREKIMAYIIRNIERYIGARKSRYERLYGRKFCVTHKNFNISENLKNNNPLNNSLNKDTNKSDRKNNKRNMKLISFFKSFCLNLRIVLSTVCFWTGKRLGNYLVVLYMFVKTLWLTNAISQLFLLNSFIGNNYHAFGIEIIQMLLSGQEWHELRHFPRVTYCDFKIREIGNSHDWTVQCVLRINLFNEVIYIFMWFWLCILAIFTAIDYISWTCRFFLPGDKLRFIKRHLDIYNCNIPMHLINNYNNKNNIKNSNDKSNVKQNENMKKSTECQDNFDILDINREKEMIREFTFNYLKDDGIFAMRILASSASDLIVTEIISYLWKNFKVSYVCNQVIEDTHLVDTPTSSKSSSTSSNLSQSIHASSAASSPNPDKNLLSKKLTTFQYPNIDQIYNSEEKIGPTSFATNENLTAKLSISQLNSSGINSPHKVTPSFNTTQSYASMQPIHLPHQFSIDDSNNQIKKIPTNKDSFNIISLHHRVNLMENSNYVNNSKDTDV
jgi:hypothetical protein